MNNLFSQNKHHIIHLHKVDSTNNYATKLVSKTNPIEGTVIRADFQSKGRGQIGRNWHSDKGENLLMSIILFPSFVTISEQFIISKMVACSLCDFLAELGAKNVYVKWPNDIYVNDEKIAGILIQNQLQGRVIKNTIVGIGLNVNQLTWPKSIPNPTSLRLLLNNKFEIIHLCSDLVECLIENYNSIKGGSNEFINERYHEQLYKRGIKHKFYCDQNNFIGEVKEVLSTGELVIVVNGVEKKFSFGEISFLEKSK